MTAQTPRAKAVHLQLLVLPVLACHSLWMAGSVGEMEKGDWIKLQYTNESGAVVKEIWAQTLVQGIPNLDREVEDTIAHMNMPRITYDVIGRQKEKPRLKQNAGLSGGACDDANSHD